MFGASIVAIFLLHFKFSDLSTISTRPLGAVKMLLAMSTLSDSIFWGNRKLLF